jgi:peptide-methionine (S)-S-oxide reductase
MKGAEKPGKIPIFNASGAYPGKIVTEMTPAGKFYPAEEYHQRYIKKRGGGSCRI